MHEIEIKLAENHPAADGHFPGNPIIPGAVLLDAVVRTIEATDRREPGAFKISAAKFLQPVRPGDTLTVGLTPRPDGGVRFEGKVRSQTVVTGLWLPA
jgi:3-hydroxyacyl-[acyl-carrier-protein] dehydratase